MFQKSRTQIKLCVLFKKTLKSMYLANNYVYLFLKYGIQLAILINYT